MNKADAEDVAVQRITGEMEVFLSTRNFYRDWFLYAENMEIFAAYESAGSWDYNDSSWSVATGEDSYIDHIKFYIDRWAINDDILLILDYMYTDNTYLSTQLRNADREVELKNVTGGNILKRTERIENYC